MIFEQRNRNCRLRRSIRRFHPSNNIQVPQRETPLRRALEIPAMRGSLDAVSGYSARKSQASSSAISVKIATVKHTKPLPTLFQPFEYFMTPDLNLRSPCWRRQETFEKPSSAPFLDQRFRNALLMPNSSRPVAKLQDIGIMVKRDHPPRLLSPLEPKITSETMAARDIGWMK